MLFESLLYQYRVFRFHTTEGHFTHKTEGPCPLHSKILVGRKGWDRPSSLHIRRWRSKSPKKLSWMKSLHGFLHGRLWIMWHGLLKFASDPPSRGRPSANCNGSCHSQGLSQLHGHGPWLVCEMSLMRCIHLYADPTVWLVTTFLLAGGWQARDSWCLRKLIYQQSENTSNYFIV